MRISTALKTLLVLVVLGGLYAGARFLFPDALKLREMQVREWWRSPRIQARVKMWEEVEKDGVLVRWKGMSTPQKAEVVGDLVVDVRKELEASFRVRFPKVLDVYLFADPEQDVYYETDGRSELLLCVPRDEDWMPEGFGGSRNHVAEVASTMSLWVNCFQNLDPAWPGTPFGESLATFVAWNWVVPALWRSHKELAWTVPYNYYVASGPARYAELAGNPPHEGVEGHTWGPLDTFWLHFLQKHGPDQVEAIVMDACSLMGDHAIEELARRIEQLAGDKDLAEELREAARKSEIPLQPGR